MSEHAYDCGCDVVFCECGSMNCNAPWEIKYCPTHAAAAEMLKLIKANAEFPDSEYEMEEIIGFRWTTVLPARELLNKIGVDYEGKAEQDNRQTEQLSE